MKNIIFIITLILSVNVYAQNGFKKPKVFVRVYNLQGKKTDKGKVLEVTDSTLVLKRNKGLVKIPVSEIGSIKTKRSAGNNVLMGAATGITASVILFGVAGNTSDNCGQCLTYSEVVTLLDFLLNIFQGIA